MTIGRGYNDALNLNLLLNKWRIQKKSYDNQFYATSTQETLEIGA